jgi:hypothetical protein
MEYALIKSGRIEQIIVADAEFLPAIQDQWDHIAHADGVCAIGWGWDGGFVPPPAPAVEEGA